MMYLCFWYKPDERATRMAIFAASIAVAGYASRSRDDASAHTQRVRWSHSHGCGLHVGTSRPVRLAMAVSVIEIVPSACPDPSFILEGIPAVLVGILIFFFLPDYPETAKFLSEEERQIAVERMGPFAPKGTDKHFDKKDFIKTITAWQFWAFAYV